MNSLLSNSLSIVSFSISKIFIYFPPAIASFTSVGDGLFLNTLNQNLVFYILNYNTKCLLSLKL